MKQILTSDLHFGVRGNSNTFLEITQKWAHDFLIPNIKKYDVEKLNILGDVFDDRSEISTKTENIALEIFEELNKIVDINIIAGNHDLFFRNRRDVNSLKKFKKFNRINVIEEIYTEKVDGRKLLYCPWLIDTNELRDFISKHGKYDICFGHFPINGFEMVKGVPEKSGMGQEFFRENFSKVFSGHFHIRDEQGSILFVGNPFQTQWGDYGNDKGIYLFDTNNLQTTFIQNDVSPVFKKIYLSQLKEKKVDYNSLSGQFIQLILDSEFTDKVLEKLREVIQSKNPLSFTIDGDDKKTCLDVDLIQDSINNPIDYLISYEKELKLENDIDREKLIKKTLEVHNLCLA